MLSQRCMFKIAKYKNLVENLYKKKSLLDMYEEDLLLYNLYGW